MHERHAGASPEPLRTGAVAPAGAAKAHSPAGPQPPVLPAGQRSSLQRVSPLHRKFSSDQNLALSGPGSAPASPRPAAMAGGSRFAAVVAQAAAAAAAAAGEGGAHAGSSEPPSVNGRTQPPTTTAAARYAPHTGGTEHQPSVGSAGDTESLPYQHAVETYGTPAHSRLEHVHAHHRSHSDSDVCVPKTSPPAATTGQGHSAPVRGHSAGTILPFAGLQTVAETSQEFRSGNSGQLSGVPSLASPQQTPGSNEGLGAMGGGSPAAESVEASKSCLDDAAACVTLSETHAAASPQLKSTSAAESAALLHAHVQAQQGSSGGASGGAAGTARSRHSAEGSATLWLSSAGSMSTGGKATSSVATSSAAAPFPYAADRSVSFLNTGGASSTLRENPSISNTAPSNAGTTPQQPPHGPLPAQHTPPEHPSGTFSETSATAMMLPNDGEESQHTQHAQHSAHLQVNFDTFAPPDSTAPPVRSPGSSTAESAAQQTGSGSQQSGVLRKDSDSHSMHMTERAGFLVPGEPVASPVQTLDTSCVLPPLGPHTHACIVCISFASARYSWCFD